MGEDELADEGLSSILRFFTGEGNKLGEMGTSRQVFF
jgi:hypothetical protein